MHSILFFILFFNTTPEIDFEEPEPYWIPVVESVGANLLLWSYNHFIYDRPFAEIGWDTIKKNFETGWGWDADQMRINMYLHPFQGGVYFNTARSLGYGYWGSLVTSFIGSVQWEYFMENEPPSVNDLIMTTLAGAAFGEVFYKLSQIVLDGKENEGLWKKFMREGAIWPFNPSHGFNRLIYGKTFDIITVPKKNKSSYIIDFSIGRNNIGELTPTSPRFLLYKLGVLHEIPFFKTEFLTPMDSFFFYLEAHNEFEITHFRIDGILFGKQIYIDKNSGLIWGLFQYSDYEKNDIYKIGGISLAPGIIYRFQTLNTLTILSAKLGYLLMGAANSDYASNYTVGELLDTKDYNMGNGISAKIQVSTLIAKTFMFSCLYRSWWVHTLTGAPGDEFIQFLVPSARLFFWDNFYVEAQILFYFRQGFYTDYDDVFLNNREQRVTFGGVF
ncbi:DUF3943 domain-containing protein [bacterium]|nr:DUF3943 domain-containing protein [bacterium]